MAYKLAALLLLCLTSSAFGQGPANADLDDLIKNIFNTDSTTGKPVVVNPTPPTPTPTKPTVINPVPTRTTVLDPPKYKSCGFEKECVQSFLCRNDTISTDGVGIIDIRINGEDCTYLEVCCDIPNKTNEPIITPKPAEEHEGCGYANPGGVGFRITGQQDNEAEFGEFPWMVAILREEDAAGEILNLYECGGALVAPNVVITAAHCVQNRLANTLVVRAGEWDTQSRSEILPHEDRRVREIISHEKYNKGALHNDVAILILESPFEWQENIRPICLPESNVNFDHSRCFATGWGKDKFGRDGQYQVILKKIDLPVVPHDQCQANLRKTRLGLYYNLHESFICAGGEKDKDTCKGDGGSPLVCPIPGVKDRYYHAGIVAWGIGCGVENVPGVYANVPHLRSWISTKLEQRGIDFRHFTA